MLEVVVRSAGTAPSSENIIMMCLLTNAYIYRCGICKGSPDLEMAGLSCWGGRRIFISTRHSSSQAFSKLEAVVVAGVFAAASARCPVVPADLITVCLKQGVVKVRSPLPDCPEELQFWWAEMGPGLTTAQHRRWSRRHQKITELFLEHRAVVNLFT